MTTTTSTIHRDLHKLRALLAKFAELSAAMQVQCTERLDLLQAQLEELEEPAR